MQLFIKAHTVLLFSISKRPQPSNQPTEKPLDLCCSLHKVECCLLTSLFFVLCNFTYIGFIFLVRFSVKFSFVLFSPPCAHTIYSSCALFLSHSLSVSLSSCLFSSPRSHSVFVVKRNIVINNFSFVRSFVLLPDYVLFFCFGFSCHFCFL